MALFGVRNYTGLCGQIILRLRSMPHLISFIVVIAVYSFTSTVNSYHGHVETVS